MRSAPFRPASCRLAPADEANLVLDHPGQVNVFLVAAQLAPGGFVDPGGAPDLTALRAVLRGRVRTIPRLCRRVVPAGRRHRWAETTPDLEHHVRLVDPVDGRAGLERLCAELMVTPLARDRPLWEILLVPGVGEAGQDLLAAVLRIHHAIADGMEAVAIVHRLFDPGGPVVPPARSGPTAPGTGVPGAPGPVRAARHHGLLRALGRFRRALTRIRATLTATGVGPSILLGDRGDHRAVMFLGADLAGLSASARQADATVNDVLLTAVAAGFAAALAAAGEPVPDRLPVSVPVALPRRGQAGNQVGIMLVRLPLAPMEPSDRLRLIAEQTRPEKDRARDQGTLEFMRGPVGARLMDRVGRRQHLVAGFVTNVPGPAAPLRLAGAPVTAVWPVPVQSGNVRVAVAALSCAGGLFCGVHVDADHVPGPVFARAMGAELRRAAGPPPGPAPGRSPGREGRAGPVD